MSCSLRFTYCVIRPLMMMPVPPGWYIEVLESSVLRVDLKFIFSLESNQYPRVCPLPPAPQLYPILANRSISMWYFSFSNVTTVTFTSHFLCRRVVCLTVHNPAPALLFLRRYAAQFGNFVPFEPFLRPFHFTFDGCLV